MNPTPYYRFPVIMSFLLLAVLLLAGIFWYQQSQQQPQQHAVSVATTIFPLTDIARNIAGDRASVVQLIPSGASPHSYALTPQDLQKLQRAKTLFAIGHGLDDWSAVPAAKSVNVPVYTVDTNITLKSFTESHTDHDDESTDNDEEYSIDPHYWLSVPNAKIIAQTITDQLIAIDPENTDAYQANLQAYLGELDALDQGLTEISQTLSQKNFIAIHNAWSYFSNAYDLSLIATYEPVEGKEPSIADIASLRGLIEQNDITTFYTEPQKQSNSATRLMQEEFELQVRVLDPVGGIGERDSYINLMRYNMDQLTQ